MTIKDNTEVIFNNSQKRTDWMKQFTTHKDYIKALSAFTPLNEVIGKDELYALNTDVKLASDGVTILESIIF